VLLVCALACVVASVSAQVTQVISIEIGGPPPQNCLVHIDPWTGEVKKRVPMAAARNITRPHFLAAHSPASPVTPFTWSVMVGSVNTRANHTLIPYNARTLEVTPLHPALVVSGEINALVYDASSSSLVGFETDSSATPHTHWFGRLDFNTGKMVRLQQIPAPWAPRLEYDWVMDNDRGVMYAVLNDLRSCAFAEFDAKNPTTKPKITALPNHECLHNLMLQPGPTGKPATLISFCQPEFPRFHNATLCLVDPATAKTTAVSKVFHEEGDNFHTAVAFQPGWVFASGLSGGRLWLFNYEAKNVTELRHRPPPGKFFVGGNSVTL
jgi:hypothetical protein